MQPSKMAANMEFSEALMAMLAMCVVMGFILTYFCVIPAIKAFKKRKELIDNYWETDPRWGDDTFNFSPRLPSDYKHDKKYSRLACSRSSRYVHLVT